MLLAIENPQSPDIDMGRNSYLIQRVKKAFDHAHKILRYAVSKHRSATSSMLSLIINDSDDILTERLPKMPPKFNDNTERRGTGPNSCSSKGDQDDAASDKSKNKNRKKKLRREKQLKRKKDNEKSVEVEVPTDSEEELQDINCYTSEGFSDEQLNGSSKKRKR